MAFEIYKYLMIDLPLEILIGGTALAGGAAGALLSYVVNMRKVSQGDTQFLIEKLIDQNKMLETQNRELQKSRSMAEERQDRLRSELYDFERKYELDMKEMRRRIDRLTVENAFWKNAYVELPYVHWVQDMSGNIISVNRRFEDTMLRPQEMTSQQVIGQRDGAIFNAETAALNASKNRVALYSPKKYNRSKQKFYGLDGRLLAESHVERYVQHDHNLPIAIATILLPDISQIQNSKE